MKKPDFHPKFNITILLLFLYLTMVPPAEAGTLKGTVKGKNGQFKKNVRVQIGGPETKTTFTNKKGIFTINLSGGKYTIKITERNRSMVFKVDVPKEKNKTKNATFKLKW